MKGKGKLRPKVKGALRHSQHGTIAQMRKHLDDVKTHREWTTTARVQKAHENAQNILSEIHHLTTGNSLGRSGGTWP